MLIIGSSGSGKTSLLLRLLLENNFLDYETLTIFTSTPNQQEYQFLYHGFKNGLSKHSLVSILLEQDKFKGIPIPTLIKMYKEQTPTENGGITITLTDKTDQLTPADKLDKNKKNLIIFDDCVNQKNQRVLESFFIRGRHNSCNSIYLSQSYFDLNRLIRLNSNIFILFKLSQRNKTDVYNSVVGSIMDKNEFDALADNAWSKKFGYLVINRNDERIITDVFEEDEDSQDEEI
jgi:hypothetical protein